MENLVNYANYGQGFNLESEVRHSPINLFPYVRKRVGYLFLDGMDDVDDKLLKYQQQTIKMSESNGTQKDE